MARRYWLMKTEPDVFSVDNLKALPKKTTPWDGIRNYQARNYMRDDMQAGDGVLFYHSRCKPPAVVAVCRIARTAYPDHPAWDRKGDYYDPKASPENPRWCMVDVQHVADLPAPVDLAAIKAHKTLSEMLVAQRGQRLSIQPVSAAHFRALHRLGGLPTVEL
jgi:predicted RNA-binding protein with PUA-like domain